MSLEHCYCWIKIFRSVCLPSAFERICWI